MVKSLEVKMKAINWKILFITSALCLLMILPGAIFWESLPEQIAIHFNIEGTPDNFTSKAFAVFLIPSLMALGQIICAVSVDLEEVKHGNKNSKFSAVGKWILPVMTIVLQTAILGYALGWSIDMRVTAMILAGLVLIVTGICLFDLDYIKNYNIEPEKAKKINRFMGYETVVLGALFIISAFLPPWFSAVCLGLIIPYTVIGVIYGIKEGRKK